MSGREVIPAGVFDPANFPDESVVQVGRVLYIKNHPVDFCQWRGTDGSYTANSSLKREASNLKRPVVQILRVGDGNE